MLKRQEKVNYFWNSILLISFLLPSVAMSENSGKELYETRCQKCHDLPDPNKVPNVGWEKRLKLMAKLAKLTPAEKKEVLSYLQGHVKKVTKTVSLAEDRRLFEEKCSLCHTLDRVYLIPLTDETRRHIVKRMQGKNPGWISEKEATLIVDYLSKAPKVVRNKKAKGKAQDIFVERCSACHSLQRIYSKIKEDKIPAWAHIVQRMQTKAPQWLSSAEAKKIIEYLQSAQLKNRRSGN